MDISGLNKLHHAPPSLEGVKTYDLSWGNDDSSFPTSNNSM